MRDIKFRGKRIDNGEWVYGSLLVSKGPVNPGCSYICPEVFAGSFDPEDCSLMLGGFIKIDPATVGQFTGLCDKNGAEIYEGDVLKGTSYLYGYQLQNGKQFEYHGHVEWGGQCDVGLCWLLTDMDNSGSWELKQTVHRNMIDYCTGKVTGTIFDAQKEG